jgi:hypothetical protein
MPLVRRCGVAFWSSELVRVFSGESLRDRTVAPTELTFRSLSCSTPTKPGATTS